MVWSEISSLDNFFYYGELPIEDATRHDIAVGAVQPKRSLSYNREDSAGVDGYENFPNGFFAEVSLKYDIINWIGWRNQQVGDGRDDTLDRRVAASQSTIFVKRKGSEVDINILYVALAKINEPQQLSIAAGGAI
jgi:hypothetical protein